MRNIQINYEKMRQIALTQNYQKVWIVEQDMIIEEDTLSKLLEVQAPIVTAFYALRHGEPQPNIFRYEHNVRGLGNIYKWRELKSSWGKTIRVTGGAMGCLLLDRSALDFNFEIGEPRAPDMAFMIHCAQKGIEMQARLDCVCGHIKANGDVLYPDRETGYRIERMNQRGGD